MQWCKKSSGPDLECAVQHGSSQGSFLSVKDHKSSTASPSQVSRMQLQCMTNLGFMVALKANVYYKQVS